MDSNTHSASSSGGGSPDDGLAALAAEVEVLAAQDLDRLSAAVRAQRPFDLAAAAGPPGRPVAPGTGGHRRPRGCRGRPRRAGRLDRGLAAQPAAPEHRAARSAVRTARALFGGPLKETAAALVAGRYRWPTLRWSPTAPQELPDHLKLEADPVLVELAGRLDPPQLRRAVEHLCRVADPEGADRRAERRHERRGVWLSPTWEGMVAIDGLLDPEAGHLQQAALEPLARPAAANDDRKGGQRTADALTELCRRSLAGGGLPKAGGVRPQLLVTVDLDSLLGRPGAVGGEAGWAGGLLPPEACRRLACDGAVTRVVISRQPNHSDPAHGHGTDHGPVNDPRMSPIPTLGLTTTLALRSAFSGGSGRPWSCSRRSWAAPPVSPWTSAAAPGSSSPPSAAPWASGTAAVSSPAVTDPWPGATPIIWSTGSTAAPPTSPTSPCCAGLITGPSMRAAGS